MERLLGSVVTDPRVTVLAEASNSPGGHLSGLTTGNARAGHIAFGEPVTLRLWNRDCFACVLPLRGRARLEQYPQAIQGLNGPFFLLPKSDQQWQLSPDCELLELQIAAESETGERIMEALTQPRDACGRIDCARVMMESLPWRLHHGRRYADKLNLLRGIRREFLALFGLCHQQRGPVQGPRVMDPRVLRAMEYLLTLAPGEYDLDAVCEVAHMSARGLYYAFERSIDCTPYAYFRACHLIRVRLSLLRDRECRHAIAWHASAHGFQHMSRFAAHYRAHFGELPSETRQRVARFLHAF